MKKGIAFYLSAVAAVLGAIGVALAAYSSMISTDNALANMPLVIGAGVVGVVLVIAAMLAPASMGDHNPVTAIGVLAAIALFSYLDPIFAILLSAVVLGEPLGMTSIIGAVLVLGSTLVSELKA